MVPEIPSSPRPSMVRMPRNRGPWNRRLSYAVSTLVGKGRGSRRGAGPPAAGSAAPRGSETILLVEDDETVRQTAQEMLEMSGYRVIETSDTADSRRLAAQHRGPIHLLLTDVIMPGMSGPALAAQVASLRPGIRVLYMSGYTGDALGQRGMVEPDMAFLQKPFTPEALARKVRETLDDAPAAGGSR